MDKMVDLKSSPEERKKEAKSMMATPSWKPPPYPYGTRITLNDAHAKAFPGLLDCKIGQEVTITAKAKIIEISESTDAREGSKQESCSVEFQITKLALDYEQPSKPAAKVSTRAKGGKIEYQMEAD